MLRSATKGFVIALTLACPPVAPAVAQLPPADTVHALALAAAALHDSGRAWGPRIWPEFRPDTIPLLFVLPGWGTTVMNFPAALPPGFQPVPGIAEAGYEPQAQRGAASTSSELAGRRVAQMSPPSLARADLIGLAMHEAFHVFERSVERPERRFGRGEAAWLVSRYPAFDVENEAGMALEGRILRAALAARDTGRALALALQYIAVREQRYRALDPQFAEFETMAELNEGLAEYALLRARSFVGAQPLAEPTVRRLDSLTSSGSRSIRLRFYSTGSGLALLLDRLAGAAWKRQLVEENLTLFELAARMSGFRDVERTAVRRAAAAFDLSGLRVQAGRAVEALRGERARRLDSILAQPGIRVELDGAALPGRFIGLCGFDPQNMLQAGDGVVLHTRWLHICSGEAFDGEFNTPVVQRAGNTRLEAVVGPDSAVVVTIRGTRVSLADPTKLGGAEDIRIESPGLTLRLARADLERAGPVLRITLLPK